MFLSYIYHTSMKYLEFFNYHMLFLDLSNLILYKNYLKFFVTTSTNGLKFNDI
jgi:hypothetical protein